MQVAVGTKENELSAAPRVLMTLDLRGRVVFGDALFTQRELSVQVLYQGGDYIWFVKDNQARLKEDVAQKTQKEHGRLEQRTLTAIPDEAGFIDWPRIQQVFKLERKVTYLTTGVVTAETVYASE